MIEATWPSEFIDPHNTLVLILGTVQPAMDTTEDNPVVHDPSQAIQAFTQAAQKFSGYCTHHCEIPDDNIYNAFNDPESTLYPAIEIADFLRIRSRKIQHIRTVLCYCVGYCRTHTQDVSLFPRYTRERGYPESELHIETLAYLLNTNIKSTSLVRRILFFDGHFIEGALSNSDHHATTLVNQLEQAFIQPVEQTTVNDNIAILYAYQSDTHLESNNRHGTLQQLPFSQALLKALNQNQAQATLHSIYAQIRKDLEQSNSTWIRTDLILSKPSAENQHIKQHRTASIPLLSHSEPPDTLYASGRKLYLFHSQRLSVIDSTSHNPSQPPIMEFQHRDIQPVIQGGHIYIATTEETLQCFREDDMQHPLWTHSTGQRLLDPILLNEDTLYVISRVEPTHSRQIHLGQASTYEIHALDTLTGRIRWHISLLTESIQRATLQGGYLFLRTEEQRLYAFATTDPQHNWSFTVHNAFFCLDPIVFRQHVYLVTNDSQTNNCTLHILKLSTGEQHLSYGSDRDPLDISYEPLVYDNFVYIVNNERDSSGKTTQKLRVFDIKHGQNIDIPQLPTDIARRPLIIHNQLYLITSGNQKQASTVHIINASTRLNEGHISLQGPARLLGYQYKGIICASPLVNGRTLYIPCHLVRTPTEKINKSCVFALDTLTQRLTLLEILDGEIIAQPILAQNKLYLTLQRKISTPGSPQNSIRYDIVIVS